MLKNYLKKHDLFKQLFWQAKLFLILLLSLFFCSNSLAENETEVIKAVSNNCLNQSKSHYEEVWCRIKEKDPSNKLSSLHEFRKNSQNTQYLLLKRPAKKWHISLNKPPIEKANSSQKDTLVISDQTIEKLSPSSRPLNEKITKITYEKVLTKKQKNLNHCTLAKKIIHCKDDRFSLQSNKSLNQLAIGSLSKNNKLVVNEDLESPPIRAASLMYRDYIEKMLSIGLGYSTMSFTKFFTIYEDSKKQSLIFSKRMFDMFELLKKERKTNGIKDRYDDNYPSSISACMELSTRLIVCDNKAQNWVYQRE